MTQSTSPLRRIPGLARQRFAVLLARVSRVRLPHLDTVRLALLADPRRLGRILISGLRALFVRLFTTRPDKSSARLLLVSILFGGLYLVIAGRLVHLAVRTDEPATIRRAAGSEINTTRPAIVDRNGIMMATDVPVLSAFAEPRRILDKDEAAELLNAVFPDLDGRELREKLGSRKGFVWIKREITPQQQAQVHRLGLPGVGFLPEAKRVYPNGADGAHVLGFANIDNIGIAGLEKYIDGQGLQDLKGLGFLDAKTDLKPIETSLDLRVTHAVREEIAGAVKRYDAKAGAGLVLDVDTGEVIAHVTYPDYDPNNPVDALKPDNINRLAVGVYEMGSTFKALTVAMALDSGRFTLNSTLDARSALRYGKFKIGDFHGKNRVLTVPEVFIYSSNIGTARMALAVGVEGHKAFLRKLGQLDRMRTELPESAEPIVPQRWGELNTMTIAFGHGLAVAPLQAAAATAALVNGGKLMTPTYLKRSREEATKVAKQVIKPETSEAMRFVMRLNAEKGSAKRADVPGYYVGGKTGTAEKVIGGRYSKNKVFTTFMAITPADKPRYLITVLLDEPKGTPETGGAHTAAANAGPTSARIIERIMPMLDVPPRFDPPIQPFPMVARYGLKVAQ